MVKKPQLNYFPSIIETTGRSSKAFDLPTKLLQDRIIFFGGGVNEDSANFAIMQLLWLNSDDPEKPISMYINSPGGSLYDGWGIIDIINIIDAKVNTLGIGLCASMGAVLLAAGTGERKATKNCRIMIHSLSGGGLDGNYHDMKVDYKESEYLQDKMLHSLADMTKGKTTKADFDLVMQRDYYLDPIQAQFMGLIDSVV